MFERIVVLDGSEGAERVIPLVANAEKDEADIHSYFKEVTSTAHWQELDRQR